ncbi:MAG: hypothetical protein JRG90_17335 [Deltaproteobacteria bacterium]|nr:hypothetical protein [Deltaproteobacteria bacterium]
MHRELGEQHEFQIGEGGLEVFARVDLCDEIVEHAQESPHAALEPGFTIAEARFREVIAQLLQCDELLLGGLVRRLPGVGCGVSDDQREIGQDLAFLFLIGRYVVAERDGVGDQVELREPFGQCVRGLEVGRERVGVPR